MIILYVALAIVAVSLWLVFKGICILDANITEIKKTTNGLYQLFERLNEKQNAIYDDED